MKKSTIVIIGCVLVLLGLLILLPNNKSPKELDWTPDYGLSDKKPLGLYVFNSEVNELLKDRNVTKVGNPPLEYLSNVLSDTIYPPHTFIYINDHMTWDDASVHEVLNSVKGGMTGFISANYFSAGLVEQLNLNTFYSRQDSGVIKIKVGTQKFNIPSQQDLQHFTRYLKLEKDTFDVLGTIESKLVNENSNFIRVKLGKGLLILHSSPAVFTNYYLLKSGSDKYVEQVLSQLPGKDIVWFTNQKESGSISNAPLSFILSQEALRNAFYLILVGAALFFIFNAKRKQRIVPVIPPVENTTVEFTKTIGNLYFQEGSPMELLIIRSSFILEKIRSEYNIPTDKMDQEMVHMLTMKTARDIQKIQEMTDILRNIQNNQVQDPKTILVTFDNLIYQIFY